MDLKEFTKQTLVQIVEGAKEANSIIKDLDAQVHTYNDNGYGKSYPITTVDFDVAITATESEGANGGAGLRVASLMNLGGGIESKTSLKIETVGIRKYFPKEKVFTVDMVKVGKPEPDLFLLAAEKMGYKPENCVVIEDSLAGLNAALKAGMTPIAFTKYSNDYYKKEIRKMPVKYVFDDMKKVEDFLVENFSD